MRMPDRKYRILIMGCPRSGTQFLRSAFDFYGFTIGHEAHGVDGAVGYNFVNPGVRAVKRIQVRECEWVCHVIRDPRRCIPSIQVHLLRNRDRFHMCNPGKFGGLDKWWMHWNKESQKVLERAKLKGANTLTFRIEDSDDVLPYLVRELGKTIDVHHSTKIPKDVGHNRDSKPLEWDDIHDDVRNYAMEWYDGEINDKARRHSQG
jgi:hypothetical protein